MAAEIIPFAKPEMTLEEIFAELDLPEGMHGPDSIFLNPGETIHDRMPHKLAKGRAVEAAKRRATFRTV